jgi:predicted nicotinamide N-methyase
MTEKKSDEISDLLKRLEEKGAKVHVGTKQGPMISSKVLEDLKKNASPDFEAWVSWSKSF